MDEKVIKELIEQLTENLEKVESARQQVEKTVKAYDALKKDVERTGFHCAECKNHNLST